MDNFTLWALYNFTQNTPPKGRGVRFIDYDGTVLRLYSYDRFMALESMPPNPVHDGLTAQGWNYTLADAKEYVEKYGRLDVGQSYITDDGKTRLYIHLGGAELSPTLGIGINGSCVVDWGDGSNPTTLTGSSTTTRVTASHTYAAEGGYVISLDVTGELGILSNIVLPITSLHKINIGNSVTSIGSSAFSGCRSLKSVTLPDSVTSIGNYAFSSSSLTSITIPDSVTSIGNYAFSNSSLTSITIPDSVTSMGEYVFRTCTSLKSVTIGNSVSRIGVKAFYKCSSLTSIIIGNSLTRLGDDVLNQCTSLKIITIGGSVASIDFSTFDDCTSLENINVSSENENFSSVDGVLYNKDRSTLILCPQRKSSITIPDSVTSIGEYAFYCTSLTSITIPDSVTSIGDGAFSSSSLTSITIPDSVTSMGEYVFYGCKSLTSITLPDSVTSIGNGAFQNCTSLTSITIPDLVTSIGGNAFYGCSEVNAIRFKPSTPPTVKKGDAWTNVPTTCVIYVPTGSLSAYTSAANYPSSSTYTYVEY